MERLTLQISEGSSPSCKINKLMHVGVPLVFRLLVVPIRSSESGCERQALAQDGCKAFSQSMASFVIIKKKLDRIGVYRQRPVTSTKFGQLGLIAAIVGFAFKNCGSSSFAWLLLLM